MKQNKQEIPVCIGFFVFSILVLILIPSQIGLHNLTATTVTSGIQITTRSFPYFTAWVMFGASGLYLASFAVRYLIARRQSAGAPAVEKDKGDKVQFLPILSALACIYLYVFLLRKLGFILDTMLLCIAMGLYLKSSKLQLLISAVVIPVAVYFLFKLMYVNLPMGILPF